MSPRTLVCTGCGCLCDDVQVEMEGGRPVRIENACARGAAYLQAAADPRRRARAGSGGQPCSVEASIDEAARLLSAARRPVIFGLDSSTLEAQGAAIELARKLGAVLDDASSFSFGPLIERIIAQQLPTGPLSGVKDQADLLLYWGSNPTATHPRHLSRYTYYAYTEFTPAGWYPKVTLACVDVRQTELMAMSRPAIRIGPRGDRDLVAGVLGELPALTNQARQLSELIRQSRFCAVFCGPGLVQGLDGDLDAFARMVRVLGESVKLAVFPMMAETNMMGFCRSLHAQAGYVNSVGFAGRSSRGEVSHGPELSFPEQLHRQAADCVLVVGADPFSSLPRSLLSGLLRDKVKVICLDHFATPTAGAATVVVPTAVPGVESGGSMVRLDGEGITLAGPVAEGYATEEVVLGQLLERVRP